MLGIEFSITGKHIIIKIPKQFYNNNEWWWLSSQIDICVFWGSEYNLYILWEKFLEKFCITMILKIRFLDEKVAFTLEIRCRVAFHHYLTWGSFGFFQRKRKQQLKIWSYSLSLPSLMYISSHGNYIEMAWEWDLQM